MPLPHDFSSAAARHWDDAMSLIQANRFDNAGYLAGYVVECSLKCLVEMSGAAPKPFQHELATLSGRCPASRMSHGAWSPPLPLAFLARFHDHG